MNTNSLSQSNPQRGKERLRESGSSMARWPAMDRDYYRRGHYPDGRLVRLLWLAGRLQNFRRISREVTRREYGISNRTWVRDIQRLRAAGFILILSRMGGDHHFVFGGFDPRYPEAVRSGPYELDKRSATTKRSATMKEATVERQMQTSAYT